MKAFLRKLGPGLLYAGAAIGVSHLVQSTRAGAEYGLALVWAVAAANFFKFPFFEYGPRYALVTGESLIEGYRRLGRWAFALFGVLTVGTMFTIQGAVTMVTAGIAGHLLGVDWPLWTLALGLLALSAAILLTGGYLTLDRLIKYIIVMLAVSTVAAVVLALPERAGQLSLRQTWPLSSSLLLFLIPLMGWMPAPFDLAVWHSIWALEKKKAQPNLRLRDALVDFHIGYWGTAFLALCFVMLGALVVYPVGEHLPRGAVAFAARFIGIYTAILGKGAYLIIAVAALTTMFSTTLTCLDAFGRVMPRFMRQLTLPAGLTVLHRRTVWLLIVGGGALLLIFSASTMRWMVDLATALSFVTAPVFAVLNLWLIRKLPPQYRPSLVNQTIAVTGILFLTLFAGAYLHTLLAG